MSDSAHVFTLGIEEEFQIIDPETRELRSHIQQILDDGKITLKEHVKPDLRSNAGDPDELCHPFALIGTSKTIPLRRLDQPVSGGKKTILNLDR